MSSALLVEERGRSPFIPTSISDFLTLHPVLDNPRTLVEEELEVTDNSLALFVLRTVNMVKELRLWLWGVEGHPLLSKDVRERVREEDQMVTVMRDHYIWEQLNVGHWKTVGVEWRKGYTFLSICKCIFMLVLENRLADVIKECDMGLLMGASILDNLLSKMAQEVSQAIRREREEDQNGVVLECSFEQRIEQYELKAQNPNKRFPISCEENPSLEHFMQVMKNGKPLLITKGIEHWPAKQKWSVEYVRRIAGFRTVPVELGSKYTSEDWTQKLMTIDEFVDRYMNPRSNKDGDGNTAKPNLVGYVAQHHLLEQIADLGDDIKIPDYCLLGENKMVDINAWFGPASTVSPTHYDPKNNVLVQVFGTKLVRLYPPSESSYLKPYPAHSLLFNTSQIDLENSNVFQQHPDLKEAMYCEFLLEPGMMLYMPPRWWHYVKSLSPSFSVSFWFE